MTIVCNMWESFPRTLSESWDKEMPILQNVRISWFADSSDEINYSFLLNLKFIEMP